MINNKEKPQARPVSHKGTIQFFLLLFVAIITIFPSCRTQKKAAKTPLKEYGADFLFKKMAENQFHFETLSMKASIAVSSNASKNSDVELTGNIRIIRDSVIWASVSIGLGIEVARMYITQDSVFFLNRIGNEYAAESFGFFNKQFQVDLDFNILQSLLTGNDFDYYESFKFKTSYDDGRYKLTALERQKQKKYIRSNSDARRVLIQDTWLNPENFKIEAINIKSVENQTRKLQVDYSNFTKIGEQLFPQRAAFEMFMQESGKNIKSNINVGFSKIELNKEISTPFSIPEKCKRIEL
jgi:phosphotransferase system IIB component